jgi:protein O-GlcNAc transferase
MTRAIRVLPKHAVFHHNYGTVLKEQGRWQEAILYYENAVELEPHYVEAHYNMGEAYLNLGNLTKAVFCFKQSLNLKPDLTEAWNQMGNALQDMGEIEEAIESYRKALNLQPFLQEAYCQLLFLLKQTCSWKELEALENKLLLLLDRSPAFKKEDFESPFVSVAMYPDPQHNLAVAKIWSTNILEEITKLNPSFTFENRRKPKEKIIIGYLSSDFHDHATAHLMLSLFGLHDRSSFEIYCYSYGKDDGSCYRKRIQEDSDKFIDVSSLGYSDTAQRIYKDEVDILIDLKGYTTGGTGCIY